MLSTEAVETRGNYAKLTTPVSINILESIKREGGYHEYCTRTVDKMN